MDEKPGDILIVTAHPSEGGAAERAMKAVPCSCELLITGVGGMSMSWALQKRFSAGNPPSLVINAGIAGSYTERFLPGNIVIPVSDCFADMGVDDNGTFVSLFSTSLADPDAWPFRGGRIQCANNWSGLMLHEFPGVIAATVNMASGSIPVIDRIRREWNPDIETMEGAWFAYTCAMQKVDYLSLRAISNMVEPRNIEKWDIPLALERLESAIRETLKIIKSS